MNALKAWLARHRVEYVECVVSDFAGVARGKIQAANEFGDKAVKLPIAIFGQTVTGNYHMRRDNAGDRDMRCVPDPESARLTPWATQPTASVVLDCFDVDDTPVDCDPRAVLKRVLALYEARGWQPVVAPEVEFYLLAADEAEQPNGAPEPGTVAEPGEIRDPYGLYQMHELAGFFDALQVHCETQQIGIGAFSQELGAGQFEVNFKHGEALRAADDVFHFKRTLKHSAAKNNLRAYFLAKMSAQQPGSSLHIHQSVCDTGGNNVFSRDDGTASDLFNGYIAGLQTYLRDALLLFAPYANSYRRFLNYWSSPVNLEWGIDNRTVGLRVPESAPEARRIENRLAGSDVNPYLAIAGTLACGYLGMTRGLEPRAPVKGAAYDLPFALYRHFYESLDAFHNSEPMAEILGQDFVRVYCAVKEREFRDFEQRIPDWELDELGKII